MKFAVFAVTLLLATCILSVAVADTSEGLRARLAVRKGHLRGRHPYDIPNLIEKKTEVDVDAAVGNLAEAGIGDAEAFRTDSKTESLAADSGIPLSRRLNPLGNFVNDATSPHPFAALVANLLDSEKLEQRNNAPQKARKMSFTETEEQLDDFRSPSNEKMMDLLMTEIQSELQSGTRGEILINTDALKNALNDKSDSVLLFLNLLNNAYNNGGYFSGSSLNNHIRLKGPANSASDSFIQRQTNDEAPADAPADAEAIASADFNADFGAPAVVEVSDSVVAESLPAAEMITESIVNESPVIAVELSDSVAAEAPLDESPVAAVEVSDSVAAEAPMVEASAEEIPAAEAPADEAPAAEAPAIVEVSDSVIAETPAVEAPADTPAAEEAPAETQAEPVAAVEVSESVAETPAAETPAETLAETPAVEADAEPVAAVEVSSETPVEPMAIEVSDSIVSQVLDNSEPPMFEAGVAAPASETEINAAATVE